MNDFRRQAKPIVDLIADRLGLKGPAYDTPEGSQMVRTIRLMFREGYISEPVAKERLKALMMPEGLIKAVIDHELVERKRLTP